VRVWRRLLVALQPELITKGRVQMRQLICACCGGRTWVVLGPPRCHRGSDARHRADRRSEPCPVPNHSPAIAELAALLATLDAVSVIVDRSTDDGNGDHHRAGLLHLVLIDFRAFRSATRR